MGFLNRFKKPKKEKKVEVHVVKVSKVKNFRYLDDLINSGKDEIHLDADIVLDASEKYKYKDGIKFSRNNLVINGDGHTIDACGKVIIFDSSYTNVTLKNLKLKNGFSEKHGGAISNFGENLVVIEGCSFIENIANDKHGSGGAIYNNNGTITIKNSIFNGNILLGEHGNGGAIYNGGTLNIYDSTFANNMVIGEYGNGGAIYNLKKADITDSTFTGNLTKSDGGAIYNSINKTLYIRGSKFEKNMGHLDCHTHNYLSYGSDNEFDNTTYNENVVDMIFQMMLEKIKKR